MTRTSGQLPDLLAMPGRAGLHFHFAGPVLFFLAGSCFAAAPVLTEAGRVTLSLPGGRLSDLTISSSGQMYALDAQAWNVYRYPAQGVLVGQFALAGVPEAAQGHVSPQPEIAADRSGNVYIAGIWRNVSRDTFTGVFVFDASGHYSRTILTIPRVEARHIAIDRQGAIYLLGMHPAYFNRGTDLCLLIHKYGTDGKGITAFSACRSGLNLRQARGIQPGPDFSKLNQETALARSWFGGTLSTIFFPDRTLSGLRYNTSGKQLQETVLQTAAVGFRYRSLTVAALQHALLKPRVLPRFGLKRRVQCS